jgi:hypothetical protein
MMIDADELRKLSPEERVKRLKEMEHQHKKEIGEIESLIKRSLQEAKTDKIAEKVAPPPREVDITKLFTEGEREGHEREQRRGRSQQLEEQATIKYLSETKYRGNLQQQIAQDYTSLKKMMEGYISLGSLSSTQIEQLERIEQRMDIVSYQTHAQSEKMAIMMSSSRAALHSIRKYAGLE